MIVKNSSENRTTMPPIIHSQHAAFGRKAAGYKAYTHMQQDPAEWLLGQPQDPSYFESGTDTGWLTRHLLSRFEPVDSLTTYAIERNTSLFSRL